MIKNLKQQLHCICVLSELFVCRLIKTHFGVYGLEYCQHSGICTKQILKYLNKKKTLILNTKTVTVIGQNDCWLNSQCKNIFFCFCSWIKEVDVILYNLNHDLSRVLFDQLSGLVVACMPQVQRFLLDNQDLKIGIFCFSAKHPAIRNKSKDCQPQMRIIRLDRMTCLLGDFCFVHYHVKINSSVFVYYTAGFIFILKCPHPINAFNLHPDIKQPFRIVITGILKFR